ncbi:MAG: pirin family protein [Chitinophagales bacterium]|nr:pirin family protein [Chitinophagales bacterium]
MKTIIHKADTRGHANHGWLNTYHTFSFSSYHNPERVHFGALRVLNDDYVAAGMGFGKHPHDNMEIVTVPLTGALKHNDSTGREKIIRKGEVQIMSAGKGIYHSEINASHDEAVTLLQIWVLPKERNIEPRYDQKEFGVENRKNRIQTVVGPDQKEGALWINQDSWFSLSDLDAGQEITYALNKSGNGVYVFVIEGSANIEGQQLEKRDGIGISETDSILVKTSTGAELIFIEVPMQLN